MAIAYRGLRNFQRPISHLTMRAQLGGTERTIFVSQIYGGL